MPSPDPPSLATARLDLEPQRVAHAEAVAPLLADPAMHAFTGGEPPTVDELRARFRRQAAGGPPDGSERWLNWVLVERSGGVVVGTVQATVTGEGTARRAELAWVVGVAFQGRGRATEAAAAVLAWLRGDGVAAFVAHVHPDHARSAGVARALGLAPTGETQDGEDRWAG